MEFSDHFAEEHKSIRRALEVLDGMAGSVEQGQAIEKHDVNALLVFLYYFADKCHQAKEESILFPMLRESRLYQAEGDLAALMEEHSEERSMIEKTQLALFSEDRPAFVANAKKLVRILSGHSYKEEQVLFPLAEKILTREEAGRLTVEMQQFDADFGMGQIDLLKRMLDDLEAKYNPRAA